MGMSRFAGDRMKAISPLESLRWDWREEEREFTWEKNCGKDVEADVVASMRAE